MTRKVKIGGSDAATILQCDLNGQQNLTIFLGISLAYSIFTVANLFPKIKFATASTVLRMTRPASVGQKSIAIQLRFIYDGHVR